MANSGNINELSIFGIYDIFRSRNIYLTNFILRIVLEFKIFD